MDDWRLDFQMDYLYGKELKHERFWSDDIQDHAHCEFCLDRISTLAEDLHEGYCTEDEYWWICDACFNDFKDMFQWKVVT